MPTETGPWTKYQQKPKHEAFMADLASSKDFTSTAWRGVSAIAKNKVAASLAEGNQKQAAAIAARALGWGILRTTPTPPKRNESTAQAETPAMQVASETQAPPKPQKESAITSVNRRENPPGITECQKGHR